MAPSINKLLPVIDTATASACNDYEPRKVLTAPERRRATIRLMVVLMILGLTAWVVYLIAVTSPGYHYKQVDYDSAEAQSYFLPVPPGSFLKASSNGMIPNNITCPCLGQPYSSWCNFIDFYLITCNQATNYQLNVTMISTADSSSCNRHVIPPNVAFACQDVPGCSSTLNTVYDFTDTKTYIETPNLASPFRVFDIVSTNMQSNIQINNQTIYDNLNSSSLERYNHSILVLSLLQSMVAQVFDCNTSSTVQQFWDRGNQCGWNLYPQIAAKFNGSKFAFGMTINYKAYTTRCQPKHCNILVKDNFRTRFLRAMGEVGGVASLILLGIQVVIWPIVALICRFSQPDMPIGSVPSAINNLFSTG